MGRGPSIEGRKNAEDAKRAKVFTKLIREITVATRAGVADPSANPRLRAAVDKALSANMTKDTIERAIKRGSGAEGADHMQELRYEGYGPSGVRVNCVCPGDVNTPMVAAYFANAPDPAALRAEVYSKYALRRIAEPQEIAQVVCFLASSASSFITGGVLIVDGGLTSKCY